MLNHPSFENQATPSPTTVSLSLIKAMDQENRRRIILYFIARRQWQFEPLLACVNRRWPIRPFSFFAN